MSGQRLADTALKLVGTRFVFHGRDPRVGLDCVGVLAVALAAAGVTAALPDRYTLRTRVPSLASLDELAGACGLCPASLPLRPGDVLLARVGACQLHALIAVGPAAFVHAHAGLKRVVVQPGPLAWPLAGHWRLPDAMPVIAN